MTSTLPTIDEIRSEFSELDDSTDRLSYLIELGEALPEFPAAARVETNRVQGCQSNVWLIVERMTGSPPRMELSADSDAPMVKGLVAILLSAYSGQTPRDALALPIEKLFESLKLKSFISPMRSNGLFSMVRFVRDLAQRWEDSAATTSGATPSNSTKATDESTKPAEVSVVKVHDRSPLTESEVVALRADFPILATTVNEGQPLVYLDNGATTQRPRQVLDAMRAVYEQYFSNVHRGGHELAARTTQAYESARQACQRLLNARQLHEIIFTSGTTAAINLVARSWGDANLKAGDEVLLSVMEHHSNLVPWQQLAARTGCQLRYAPVADDGQLDWNGFTKLLSSRTKLVAITAVSNVTGTINPVAQIVQAAHAVGAVVLVDAAQAAPHQTLDVQQLDVDFLAFSGHKMLGPTGIGVLYGKEQLLDAMPPFLGGGSMIRTVTLDGFTPAQLPAKFEAGTPPIVEAIGLGAAVEYLERIGLERIHAHEQVLVRRAHERLEALDGVRILGPAPEHKGGIVTFAVTGLHADEVAKALDAQGVAIRAGHHCAMPLHERFQLNASSRASFYLYNTLAEVDRLGDALAKAIRLFRR